MKLKISEPIVGGGVGSGNWGHAGIPGKRGGSQSRQSAMSVRSGADWLQRYEAATGRKHPFAAEIEAARKSVRDKPIEVDELVEIGGSRWQKNGMDRVYFNDGASRYGIETGRYGTGNISSATLNGEKISNTSARKIINKVNSMKYYFDANDGKFHYKTSGYLGDATGDEASEIASVVFAHIRNEVYQNREKGE